MTKIKLGKTHDLHEVCLEPVTTSLVTSRKEVSTQTNIGACYLLSLPIIASPMETISGKAMASAMNEAGGIAIIHRNVKHYEDYSTPNRPPTGWAIKLKGWKEHLEAIDKYCGLQRNDIICLDVANGHSQVLVEAVGELRQELDKNYNEIHLMTGNVATAQGALALADAGANSVRVGIGSGGVCTTRNQTGVYVPMVTALMEIRKKLDDLGLHVGVIADGGMQEAGDIAKALAAGAHAVMLGGMLSGTEEAEIRDRYYGMASAQAKGSEWFVEGKDVIPQRKGSVQKVIWELKDGLRSAMSYCGAFNLDEFYERSQFIEVGSKRERLR